MHRQPIGDDDAREVDLDDVDEEPPPPTIDPDERIELDEAEPDPGLEDDRPV